MRRSRLRRPVGGPRSSSVWTRGGTRRRFAGEPRVRVERQDLLSLEVEERVDLIFSTATFHWISDHDRLFENLARALKPGGRLVAQCGGEGNISRATRATRETMEEERFLDYF